MRPVSVTRALLRMTRPRQISGHSQISNVFIPIEAVSTRTFKLPDGIVGRHTKLFDHVSAHEISGPVDTVGAMNADKLAVIAGIHQEAVDGFEKLTHDAGVRYLLPRANDFGVVDAVP